MPTLFLRFLVHLKNHNIEFSPEGPLTHRWLPDGENDAISLDTGDSDFVLKVWFRRRGYVSGSMIEYASDREEVDPLIIPKQGILEAGIMTGFLEVKNISTDKFTAVTSNLIGDANYVSLGKEIVKKIQPPIASFLRILRIQYGQYWLNDFLPFDSRSGSIGGYCSSLLMKWSLDGKTDWKNFIPDPPAIRFTSIVMRDYASYRNYITEEDWNQIKKEASKEYSPSFSMSILIKSWEYLDQGDLKRAILEGVTALELATGEYLRGKLATLGLTVNDLGKFNEIRKRDKSMLVAALSGQVSAAEIKSIDEIITIRNNIIHEGKDPPSNAEKMLRDLINAISKLIENKDFRFPKANHGNALQDVAIWEQGKKDYESKK